MTIEYVHDIHDSRLAPFAGMRDVQLRGNEGVSPGLFIGESDKVINRALDAGVKPSCLFMEEKWVPKTQPLIDRIQAIDASVPIMIAGKHDFQAVTGYEVTRGAVATLVRPPLPTVEDIVRDAHRVVILEDVMNATNIGAIFRSAAALGVDAVLLTDRCHDPLYRRAARVSMGTVFQVPWTRVPTTLDALALLHAQKFVSVALALLPDAFAIDDPRLAHHDKLAFVIGTEGDGLAPATIKACDYTAVIPMAHNVDSLNLAAASAVALWELRRETPETPLYSNRHLL